MLPQNSSVTVAASLLVMMEGARTMTNLMGSDRFGSPYGGELMGATYTGVIGIVASLLVKNPLPAMTAAGAIGFFVILYHWQENMAVRYVNERL
jgi:hypothetical protein